MLRPEQNPFSKPSGPKKPKRELVEAYLGKEAAGLLEDDVRKPSTHDEGLGLVEKLSDEEMDAIRKERESRIWSKQQYYDWAKSFGEDKAWVDKTFTFHPDGTTSVEGDLELENITEPIFPKGLKEVGGTLDLGRLASVDGLTLPQSIGGRLYLDKVTSAKGLTFPQTVGGGLFLGILTSANGLNFPQSIGGTLDLHSLTSAEDLTLPQSIGGGLDLDGLISAKGLTLPEKVGGTVHLRILLGMEKAKLRKERPDLQIE